MREDDEDDEDDEDEDNITVPRGVGSETVSSVASESKPGVGSRERGADPGLTLADSCGKWLFF